jgi:hypothetical protein
MHCVDVPLTNSFKELLYFRALLNFHMCYVSFDRYQWNLIYDTSIVWLLWYVNFISSELLPELD